MARPVKNNCDYFPHDSDMRNHRKVKAIRTKFGITGYAIFNMLLEYLTKRDGNVMANTDIEFELLAGDFGVSAAEIRLVTEYCILLELFFIENDLLYSKSLDERLSIVYEKRMTQRGISSKQSRNNGKFASDNTEQTAVTDAEMPYIKLNKKKLNKTKVNIINKGFNQKPKKEDFNGLPESTLNAADELLFRISHKRVPHETLVALWEVFKVQNLTGENFYSNEGKVHSHYLNWVKFQKIEENGTTKQTASAKHEAGVDALLERGKRKFAAAREANPGA